MAKLTCKKIKYFMKDEKKASRGYGKLRLPRLAKDEKRHHDFFKKLSKKRDC